MATTRLKRQKRTDTGQFEFKGLSLRRLFTEMQEGDKEVKRGLARGVNISLRKSGEWADALSRMITFPG
jgi:hypothetical protein